MKRPKNLGFFGVADRENLSGTIRALSVENALQAILAMACFLYVVQTACQRHQHWAWPAQLPIQLQFGLQFRTQNSSELTKQAQLTLLGDSTIPLGPDLGH